MVELSTIWWIELLGWFLISLEYFVPKKLIEIIDAPIKQHSLNVQGRIKEDISAKLQDTSQRRQRLLSGAACVFYSLLMVVVGPKIVGFNVWVDFVAQISFTLAICIGIILLWPIFELFGLLLLASPFYSFFLFVSKCQKGSLLAYGAILQLVAIMLKRP